MGTDVKGLILVIVQGSFRGNWRGKGETGELFGRIYQCKKLSDTYNERLTSLDNICRASHRPGECLRHIVSGCSRLANGWHLHRYNQVAKIIYQQLALWYRLMELEVPYYRYTWPNIILVDRVARCLDVPALLVDMYVCVCVCVCVRAFVCVCMFVINWKKNIVFQNFAIIHIFQILLW